MGYKILGYAVWNGGKFYMKQRYGTASGAKRLAALGIVGAAVVALAVKGAHRDASS
ncbi:hypothetical protein DSM104299_02550 [Baekduia alba]|uniref:hypothetical protein n=1 Tax=Baekduia alba TaxID=2997333 RepID=UPI00234079EC|nr:hypothetical protein [Baekduia alba]WCB93830.1 hypothetical protein DSM104299_02550 [Baekduia alba]